MRRYNKKHGFGYFGAVQRNERWSYLATTPIRVVMTIWCHKMRGEWPNRYYDTRIKERTEQHKNRHGDKERVRLLKFAQEQLNGILYVLLTVAKDPDADSLEIDYCTPWESKDGVHRVKLTHLDEETGDYRVEYLDTVPLD